MAKQVAYGEATVRDRRRRGVDQPGHGDLSPASTRPRNQPGLRFPRLTRSGCPNLAPGSAASATVPGRVTSASASPAGWWPAAWDCRWRPSRRCVPAPCRARSTRSCSGTRSRRWRRPGCASAPWCACSCVHSCAPKPVGSKRRSGAGSTWWPSCRRPTGPASRRSAWSTASATTSPPRFPRHAGLRNCCGGPTLLAGRRPSRTCVPIRRPSACACRPHRGRRCVVLLLDDIYVSGGVLSECGSLPACAGARCTLIAPLAASRPDRIALHADFLGRHAV